MSLSIEIIPGALPQDGDVIDNSILRQIARPTVNLLGSIGTFILDDGAVTTPKLADGVLSADATGRAKMEDDFVNTSKIEDHAVTFDKLDTDLIADATAATPASDDLILFADVSNSNLTRQCTIAEAVDFGGARVRFTATAVQKTLSSVDNTADTITFTAAHARSDGDCVSFCQVGSGALPTGISANTAYYVKSTASDTVSLHPTRADAIAGTAKIAIAPGTTPSNSRMVYLPILASTNADAIQVSSGTTLLAGVYDVVFRTALSGTDYVVTGIVKPPTSPADERGWLMLHADDAGSTSVVRVGTYSDRANGFVNFSEVHVVISAPT